MSTIENQPLSHATRALPRAAFQNFLVSNPRTLEQAIHKAVCAVPDELLKPVTPHDLGPLSRARALLKLMAFCYARQIYGSSDLSDIAKREEDFERWNGAGFPQPPDIRQFRIENRTALHRCLVMALHFLVEQKISLGVLTKVNDAQLTEEADRRLVMATFLDSLELDGEPARNPPVEICYLFANRPARGH